ncbi:ROK family transcriptional regulator [Streptosporangium canum]|uniref:ROK family protein n=1 Tax=Streptosporangium canum TaxID=324952 RepID=UPI00344145C2
MHQQSGDASLLRRLNSAAILGILRNTDVATLAELARAARVSRPTVEAIVEELLVEGWVEEYTEEYGGGRRGRPAKRFRFRTSARKVVGLSVGAYRLHAMTADLGGTIIATRRVAVFQEMTPGERIDEIARLVGQCAAEAGVEIRDLAAVAVGTTGVVDGQGRVVKSNVLPDWAGVPLQAELSARLSVPVLVENDMRLAVLAEHWRGVAEGRSDVVYLFTGNRLSLGLLIGGTPYRGAHSASGEIGEPAKGLWMAFGHVTEYAMSVEPGELRSPAQAAEFAFARAREGEERAAKAVEDFATALAEGLATVVNPLDPEMVVIGGSLAPGGELLVEPIQRYLDRVCVYPPRVLASRFGAESIVVGAVKAALNHAETTLFRRDS